MHRYLWIIIIFPMLDRLISTFHLKKYLFYGDPKSTGPSEGIKEEVTVIFGLP